jgi:hypothetical protein
LGWNGEVGYKGKHNRRRAAEIFELIQAILEFKTRSI